VRRFAAVGVFLVTRSSGVAGLQIALPLFFAIGIVATVIFAPSGLAASTVVLRAESNATTRLVLLLAWTALSLPVARAILSTRENSFLRSLPIPRWQIVVWLGALMIAAELPWLVLWTRGGGLSSGLAAMLTAVALHACIVARVRTPIDAAFVAATCAAWVAPFAAARIAVGALISACALSRAWRRALELDASGLRARIVGPPAFALATAYGLIAIRRHLALLVRAALIVLLGMTWVGLALYSNETAWSEGDGALRLVLAVWIPCSVLAAATLAGPVLRTEAAAEWVLVACGTSASQRRTATIGILAAAGAMAGLLTGASLGFALGRPLALRFSWAMAVGGVGAVLSALTELGARWSMRGDRSDGGRIVVALAAVIALAESALWLVRTIPLDCSTTNILDTFAQKHP
jgi:hypothetical protein